MKTVPTSLVGDKYYVAMRESTWTCTDNLISDPSRSCARRTCASWTFFPSVARPKGRSNMIFLGDLRKYILLCNKFPRTISMTYLEELCNVLFSGKSVKGPMCKTNIPYLCLILHSTPTTKSCADFPIIVAEMVLLLCGLRLVLRCTSSVGLSFTKLP